MREAIAALLRDPEGSTSDGSLTAASPGAPEWARRRKAPSKSLGPEGRSGVSGGDRGGGSEESPRDVGEKGEGPESGLAPSSGIPVADPAGKSDCLRAYAAVRGGKGTRSPQGGRPKGRGPRPELGRWPEWWTFWDEWCR